jgi:hypothetical protein
MATVKDFWIEPKDLPVTIKEVTFGYTDNRGKKVRYKVEMKNNDRQAFHTFIFGLIKSKKKNLLPWPLVNKLKNSVKITDMDAEAVQEELPLKVASRFLNSL